MNSINPTPRSRDFSLDDWLEDLDRPTSLPPALTSRNVIKELLEDPEAMDFLEKLVDVARKTRGSTAKTLLSEWERQIEPILNDRYGFINK